MRRKVKSQNIAFLVQDFHQPPRLRLFVGFIHLRFRIRLAEHIKKRSLPRILFLAMPIRHFDRFFHARHQSWTIGRRLGHFVKCTGQNQTFQSFTAERRTLFRLKRLIIQDPLAKIKKRFIRTMQIPFRHHIFNHRKPDVADSRQPINDLPFFICRKNAERRIDIWRKHFDSHPFALLHNRHDIFRFAHFGCHRSRHIFRAKMRFQIGRLVSDISIRRCVTLVERISAKRKNSIPNFLNHFGIIAPINASGFKFRFQLRHFVRHFFSHDSTDIVSAAQRVTAQNLRQLHHLFLINNHAVSFRQNRFQILMIAVDRFFAQFAGDKMRNLINRSWAIERIHSDQIANPRWFQFAKILLHSRRFKLENRRRHAFAQQFKSFLVIGRNLVHVHFQMANFLNHIHRIQNDGKVDKTKKVHFQKADVFRIMFIIHDNGSIGRSCPIQRSEFVNRTWRNHDAASVNSRLPWKIFELQCDIPKFPIAFATVDKCLKRRIIVIRSDRSVFFRFTRPRFIQAEIQDFLREQFDNGFGFAVINAKNSSDIFNDRL